MKYLIIALLFFGINFFSSCSGCSRSGRLKYNASDNGISNVSEPQHKHITGGRAIVKMTKENGVYKIIVRVNGTDMEFIFDTGASDISISNVEAMFLYKQGKISKDDILGKVNFEDATGSISEGTIINLKEVSIGGRTIYNVHASIVNNSSAPLLFGQSALRQFGKITIDYQNEEIIFE